MSHQRDEKITAFVRNVLGCGCPDEVFNKIEVLNIDLDCNALKATRIVIGDTLLIYILPYASVDIAIQCMDKLVINGKQDRDSHGYNRFRLVVPYCDDKSLEEQASALFATVAGSDEKLHIHYVDSDVLNPVL